MAFASPHQDDDPGGRRKSGPVSDAQRRTRIAHPLIATSPDVARDYGRFVEVLRRLSFHAREELSEENYPHFDKGLNGCRQVVLCAPLTGIANLRAPYLHLAGLVRKQCDLEVGARLLPDIVLLQYLASRIVEALYRFEE
jgi:hypothetical protein